MQDSMYHIVLRTSALTLAFVLMFVSGIVAPVTQQLSHQTEQYLASAVGMYAAVEPNGLNEVTAALTAKSTELDLREASLRERELAIGLSETPTADTTTYILSIILFILLVLIVTNYVLDYLRSRPRVTRKAYGQMA